MGSCRSSCSAVGAVPAFDRGPGGCWPVTGLILAGRCAPLAGQRVAGVRLGGRGSGQAWLPGGAAQHGAVGGGDDGLEVCGVAGGGRAGVEGSGAGRGPAEDGVAPGAGETMSW